MKVYILANGDPSVGISSSQSIVELPFLSLDKQERDSIREVLATAFKDILDEKVQVIYEDECGDCGGTLVNGDCPKCAEFEKQEMEAEAFADKIIRCFQEEL